MIWKPTVPPILRVALTDADSAFMAAKAMAAALVSAAEQHRLDGIQRLLATGLPPRLARIPITNVFAGSDYSARITIGSENAVADVVLDTGSSTLAVSPTVYDGTGDAHLQSTTNAQVVHYGIGGWAGPMVNTSVGFAPDVTLASTSIAIWTVQDTSIFKAASGILGLAYNGLNQAFDLTRWFDQEQKPSTTHPWPFSEPDFATFDSGFRQLIRQYDIHGQHIAPYFDDLETQGVVANKFAFHTHRSWVSKRAGNDAAIARDPLNQGLFVLGGGEEQTDLYEGAFVEVNVLDDFYYNTNLKSVQVEGYAVVAAQPLQAQYVQQCKTNSIIDSGTSVLMLAADVYAAIVGSLKQVDPAFGAAIANFTASAAGSQGLPMGQLDLAKWPNIHFVFEGSNGEDIRLTCAPHTYWQTDYPAAGQATFQIIGPLPGEDANQSVFGLPLLNNYYTVFDRSLSTSGVIRFAPIKRPAGI
jgi:hypothetical protein